MWDDKLDYGTYELSLLGVKHLHPLITKAGFDDSSIETTRPLMLALHLSHKLSCGISITSYLRFESELNKWPTSANDILYNA